MTEKMKAALAEEIDMINSWLAYEDADELVLMDTLDDARLQIEGMTEDRDPDDPLPAGLLDPATMLTVWNYCVTEEKARAAAFREERNTRPDQVVLRTDDLFAAIKQCLESAGCTNVKII